MLRSILYPLGLMATIAASIAIATPAALTASAVLDVNHVAVGAMPATGTLTID